MTRARISSTKLGKSGDWEVEQDRTNRSELVLRNGHLQVWTYDSIPCHGYVRHHVCVWSLKERQSSV